MEGCSQIISNRFLPLLNISKPLSVGPFMVPGEYDSWNVETFRNLNGWEVNEFKCFLMSLANCSLNEDNDQLNWKLNYKGVFTVKSYIHLSRKRDNNLNMSTKLIWKVKMPPSSLVIMHFYPGQVNQVGQNLG